MIIKLIKQVIKEIVILVRHEHFKEYKIFLKETNKFYCWTNLKFYQKNSDHMLILLKTKVGTRIIGTRLQNIISSVIWITSRNAIAAWKLRFYTLGDFIKITLIC